MNLRLTSRILLFFGLLAAALLITVGTLSYRSGSESLEHAAISQMVGNAIEKQATVDAWIDERLADVQQLAAHADVADKAAGLIAARPGSAAWRSLRTILLRELEPYVADARSGMTELFVIELSQGKVVASTRPSEEGKFKLGRPYFDKGRSGLYLQAPYYSADAHAPMLTAAAPLRTADGRVVAVLAVRLGLDALGAIAQRRSGLHSSEDSYLVDAGGFAVTQPRFIAEPVVLRRKLDGDATRFCVARKGGVVLANDYRGVPVISVCRWGTAHQLGLIAEIDQAEANAPARAFAQALVWISALALLAAAAIGFVLARTITRPLLALHRGVRRFADGDSTEPLPESTGGEVGLVAREFNRMAARVDERTAELAHANEGLKVANEVIDQSRTVLFRWAAGPGWPVLYVSPNVRRWGFDAEELASGKVAYASLIHPDDLARIEAGVAAFAASGAAETAQECRIVQRSGAVIWVDHHATVERDGEGRPVVFHGVVTDITTRKQAEEALRRLQRSQAAILGAVGHGIHGIDLSGKIIFENVAAARMLGWTETGLLGKPAHATMHHHHADGSAYPGETCPIYRAMRDGIVRHGTDETFWRQDGTSFPVDYTVEPLRGDANEIVGAVVVFADISERRLAENALRASEERFRTLTTATSDVVWHCTAGGECIGDVPSWRAFTGQAADEMRRFGWMRAIHPDEIPRMQEQWARAAAERSVFAPELRIRRHDGQYRDFVVKGVPIQNADGSIREWVGTCADVTERKQAEQAIRDERDFSDKLVSSLPGTFGLLNADGRYLRWNARLKTMLGLADVEMAQTNALDVIDPADRPQAEEKLREAIHKGFARQDARVSARGLSGSYSFTTVRVETAQGVRLIVTGADITRRKQMEAALRSANRDLKALNESYRIAAAVIESSAEGVMVTDAQLRIESVNPAFEHITGYAAAQVVGQSPKMLFSGKHDEAFFRRLRDTVDAQGHWRGEIWNRRQDGTVYPQETSVSVLRDAGAHIRHYASVFSDNTVQHQVETKLRELSSLDGLTGIANRRSFDEILAREWARALRDHAALSLLMMDIDFFKNYNDRHGHLQGDQCLRQVAQALSGAAHRASDVVARYGGEEFAMILPGTDAAAAARMAEKVRAAVAALALRHGGSDAAAFVTVSVGAASLIPAPASQQRELIAAADRALYQAKHAGRNRVVSAATPAYGIPETV